MLKNNIIDFIGNTPMVKLNTYKQKHQLYADIIVKIESFNPMSSVKDRVALGLIEDAINKGLINDKTVLIEPTSGNTGIGLSFIAAAKQIPLIITMPETMSIERRKIIQAFGAKLILTPGNLGMKGAIDKANELANENSNYLILGQFTNQANPLFHEKTTALEILNDTNGNFDYFVSGVGTGGTITGVSNIIKRKYPQIKIIGVEPQESAVLNNKPKGPHKIQGIGAGFIPQVLKLDNIDEVMEVNYDQAILTMKSLASTEGILAGISSGAALYAATQIAKKKENTEKTIVVVLPDTGERYLSVVDFNV